jgi:thioredoxin 1
MNLYFWIPFGILIAVFLAAYYKRYKVVKAMMSKAESDKVKVLDDANFAEVTSTGVSLVDFWAPWCTPCKVQGPIVGEVAEEIGEQANICKMDIDRNKHTAMRLKIRSIPTIMIFNDGQPVKQLVGVKTKGVLLKALNEELGK